MYVERTLTITINPLLLDEELASAGLPIVFPVDLRGYKQVDNRTSIPETAPYVYKTVQDQSTAGRKVESIAMPGVIHFKLSKNLTMAETQSLDAILAAHDHTALSTGQVQLDQEKVDLLDIKTTLAAGQTLTLAQLTTLSRIALSREA